MKSIEDTLISNYDIIQPTQSNTFGNAHGGEIVKKMDEISAICASRFYQNECVTAKISEVEFHTPIKEGDTVVIEAYVYKTGNSSINVHVEVQRENINTEKITTTTANFVMVAINKDTEPVSINEDVEVKTDLDEELYKKATKNN